MVFNPLFFNSGAGFESTVQSKTSKSSVDKFLFSDIIKVLVDEEPDSAPVGNPAGKHKSTMSILNSLLNHINSENATPKSYQNELKITDLLAVLIDGYVPEQDDAESVNNKLELSLADKDINLFLENLIDSTQNSNAIKVSLSGEGPGKYKLSPEDILKALNDGQSVVISFADAASPFVLTINPKINEGYFNIGESENKSGTESLYDYGNPAKEYKIVFQFTNSSDRPVGDADPESMQIKSPQTDTGPVIKNFAKSFNTGRFLEDGIKKYNYTEFQSKPNLTGEPGKYAMTENILSDESVKVELPEYLAGVETKTDSPPVGEYNSENKKPENVALNKNNILEADKNFGKSGPINKDGIVNLPEELKQYSNDIKSVSYTGTSSGNSIPADQKPAMTAGEQNIPVKTTVDPAVNKILDNEVKSGLKVEVDGSTIKSDLKNIDVKTENTAGKDLNEMKLSLDGKLNSPDKELKKHETADNQNSTAPKTETSVKKQGVVQSIEEGSTKINNKNNQQLSDKAVVNSDKSAESSEINIKTATPKKNSNESVINAGQTNGTVKLKVNHQLKTAKQAAGEKTDAAQNQNTKNSASSESIKIVNKNQTDGSAAAPDTESMKPGEAGIQKSDNGANKNELKTEDLKTAVKSENETKTSVKQGEPKDSGSEVKVKSTVNNTAENLKPDTSKEAAEPGSNSAEKSGDGTDNKLNLKNTGTDTEIVDSAKKQNITAAGEKSNSSELKTSEKNKTDFVSGQDKTVLSDKKPQNGFSENQVSASKDSRVDNGNIKSGLNPLKSETANIETKAAVDENFNGSGSKKNTEETIGEKSNGTTLKSEAMDNKVKTDEIGKVDLKDKDNNRLASDGKKISDNDEITVESKIKNNKIQPEDNGKTDTKVKNDLPADAKKVNDNDGTTVKSELKNGKIQPDETGKTDTKVKNDLPADAKKVNDNDGTTVKSELKNGKIQPDETVKADTKVKNDMPPDAKKVNDDGPVIKTESGSNKIITDTKIKTGSPVQESTGTGIKNSQSEEIKLNNRADENSSEKEKAESAVRASSNGEETIGIGKNKSWDNSTEKTETTTIKEKEPNSDLKNSVSDNDLPEIQNQDEVQLNDQTKKTVDKENSESKSHTVNYAHDASKHETKESHDSSKDNKVKIENTTHREPGMTNSSSEKETFSRERNSGNPGHEAGRNVEFQVREKQSFEFNMEKSVPDKIVRTGEIIKEFYRFIERGGKNTLTLQIEPENLGKVKIMLDTTDNIVKATIRVENELVKAVIESNLNDLYNKLERSGIQLNSINISLGDSDHKQAKYTASNKKSSYGKKKFEEDAPEDKSSVKSLGYNTYEYLV